MSGLAFGTAVAAVRAKAALIIAVAVVVLVAGAITYHEVRVANLKDQVRNAEKATSDMKIAWDQERTEDAAASKKRGQQYRDTETARAAAANQAEQERLTREKEITDLRVAVATGALRLRDAGAAFDRRIANMPGASTCPAIVAAADGIADMGREGGGLLGEARVLVKGLAADLAQRDAIIAADRAGQAITQ